MPIRNLVDLVRRGAVSTASYIINAGRSLSELALALRNRYGGEMQASARSVNALQNFTLRAMAAGESIGPANPILPASEIPLAGPPQEARYRYTINISIRNRNDIGQFTGDVVYHTVTIDATEQMEWQDLVNESQQEIDDMTNDNTTNDRFEIAIETFNQPLTRFNISELYRG